MSELSSLIMLLIVLTVAILWAWRQVNKQVKHKQVIHLMVDLETLSLKPNAYIRSVGAVFFGPDYLGPRFYESCDGSTQEGADISEATLSWWKDQSPEAKAALANPMHNGLNDTLTRFSQWIHQEIDYTLSGMLQRGEEMKLELWVWSNGADFDTVILSNAFARLGLPTPWQFYNVRCYRTLKNIFRNIRAEEFKGAKHDALADAVHQAEHASHIIKHVYY